MLSYACPAHMPALLLSINGHNGLEDEQNKECSKQMKIAIMF
jgi:hypothetical protein